jgi:Nucleotide-diphospho-sugar transferase
MYFEEALYSASSAKRHMPDISITLFTDVDTSSDIVDTIVHIESPNYDLRDKVQYMKQSPYEYTLFLDTDTYICQPIYELFDMLDRFEIAAVHEGGHQGYPVPDIPDSFPEFNSGVILFRNIERVHQLFDHWLTKYDSEVWLVRGRHFDQPALREMLYKSDLSLGILTSQYNCRFIDGGYVVGSVKILHRRSAHHMEDVERVLNNYQGQRVYIGNRAYKHALVGPLLRHTVAESIGSFNRPFFLLAWERLQKYLKTYGFFGTIKRMIQRIWITPKD